MYETIQRINGVAAPTARAVSLYDWREECLLASLKGNHYGEFLEALLAAIRRHGTGNATLVLDLDRLQLLDFMRETMPDLRPLCALTESYDRDISEQPQPFLGWWGGTFGGGWLEVAFIGSWFPEAAVVAMGETASLLRDFGLAATQHANRPRSRTLLYAGCWKNAPQMDAEIGKVTWDDVILPTEMLGQIREAVEGWANGKAIYEGMGFAWRRGILLIGPPGTGKTMIGKAAASALPDLPVLYVRDLREDSRRDAINAIFRRAREMKQCLLIIEDVDTLITEENRSVFLNELDGFVSNEGILLIASSNHPHKIDEAFLKRPSRFDRVFHIGLPADAERAAFCRTILARSAFAARFAPDFDFAGLIGRVVEKSKGFTPAYLKEVLTGAALSLAHKGQADVLDGRYEEAVVAQVDELRKTMRRLKNPAALAEMTTGDTGIGFRE